jgi:TonB family protein
MFPLLMMASVTLGLVATDSGAPASSDQMVRAARNGEFLWKYYPPGALKRGEQGRVAFKLTIEPTGTVSTCDVTESSGFKSLDKETCDIMGLYARVEPVRSADGRAVRAVQDGFIVWKLPPGATQVATASTRRTMPKPDQLVCRKDTKTGSLIATTTQCLTRAEWARQEKEMRDTVGRLTGGYCDGRGNPCMPPCPSATPGSGTQSCWIG